MALKVFYLLTIVWGQGFVDRIFCDEFSQATMPIRRKRQAAAVTTDFITVADIAEYLGGGTHRKISSIAMIDPNRAEVEDDAKRWPKVGFSMATDVPVVTPPPACDDTSRSNAILSILRNTTPESVLLNTVTPQGMAFAWILSEDPAATTTLKKPCDNVQVIRQRYALVVLYYATSGDSWTDSTGWLTSEDVCQWAKITCLSDQPSVLVLALSENNLIGELPEEIEVLESTEELYLFGNKLKGTIPDGIKSMKRLRNLDIERNEFSGQPLVKLYNLLNLREVHLSDNQFDEQISGPGVANWELVKDLWIGNNLFRGAIPEEIGKMESLESLLIYGNEFTGTLPSTMGANRIIELIAHENMLDGTIPESLFDNIDMTNLRLDSNNFSGQLSSAVGDLSGLAELRLGRNKFGGSLPSSLWKLTELQLLSISNNNFTGTLVDSFRGFESLNTLDLGQNSFSGTLPATIFSVPSLRLLYMSNNKFSGSIPANFGNALKLRDLYLNGNQLEGQIPPILEGQLQNLTEFLLQSNALTGTMPESICILTDDTSGVLEDLWSDCQLIDGVAEVTCSCCTQCVFETGALA